ncbi:apolipoprotein A-IV [Varanus komodoensis]|uniref:apolipoprotein A-IV n=1 Tax=Varanus komodoensis TaxID=61221 RepID=UPI001CF795BF|nr:apolipoprotein A-IV [Varanus komodoensis]
MALRAAALILGLLAAATAARADVDAEKVASVVQSYFAKWSGDASDTMGSEFTQKVQDTFKALIQNKAQDLQSLQGNMGPFTSEFLTQLKEESQKLAEHMQQKLQRFQGGISSHAAEVGGKVADTIQSVKNDFTPFVERVQTLVNENVAGMEETLKVAFQKLKENTGSLPYADQLQQSIQQQVEQMKGNLELLNEELNARVDQRMQDLHAQVSPYMQHMQEQLTRQLAGMSDHMKEKAEQLRAKMLERAKGLQDSLSHVLMELREKLQSNSGETMAYVTQVNERIEGHVEEFRQNAEQVREVFLQTLGQGMEELQQNLQSVTGEVGHMRSLEEEMNIRINDFLNSMKQTKN